MRLIQKPLAEYENVSGVQIETVREFRGVNTLDPFSIGDEFFTDMRNIVTDDYPTIKTRPGYSQLGNKIGNKILGLGVWKDKELHAVFGDGTWRRWTGSSWTTLISGLDTSADWSFTNFKGNLSDVNLIGCNGVDGLHRYDGSSVQSFGDAESEINFITTYQNRLWGAWDNELHACALNQPEEWQKFDGTDEDSYFKVIETERGEDINMLTGGLRKLTIGMKNSLHELYGGVPSDFMTQLKTEKNGFANNKSAVTLKGVLRFMHQTGIYEFSGGLLPDDTFSEIVDAFVQVDENSVAGTDGDKVYFYMDGKILVYDPEFQTWVVWDGFSPNHFAVMDNEFYIGDNGRVFKLGGDDDDGTPIDWYAITKPFNNLSTAQKMRWYRLFVTVDLAPGSSFSVYGSGSPTGNDWTQLYTNTGGDLQHSRIFVPVKEIANENYVRLKFEGSGQAKIHGYTRHLRAMPLV